MRTCRVSRSQTFQCAPPVCAECRCSIIAFHGVGNVKDGAGEGVKGVWNMEAMEHVIALGTIAPMPTIGTSQFFADACIWRKACDFTTTSSSPSDQDKYRQHDQGYQLVRKVSVTRGTRSVEDAC